MMHRDAWLTALILSIVLWVAIIFIIFSLWPAG